MQKKPPLVSVVVSAYNHERYIAECLLSIAAQDVNFDYEVFVGEDCSTDGTREVLRALEPELPSCFHILYREHNMGAVGNGEDLYARASGKYLVDIEGDDYWLDRNKLQIQVDYLESHPDCSAVFSHCVVVDENSQPSGIQYPQCADDEYSYKEFFYCSMPGQSSTQVCRREEYLHDRAEFMSMRQYEGYYQGDRRNSFLFLMEGRVRCFRETWSAYRYVKKSGSSFSASSKIDESYARREVAFARTLVAFAQSRHDTEAIEAAKLTYYRLRLKWSVGKIKSERLGDTLRELFKERRWPLYLLAVPRWYAVLVFRLLCGRGVNM